MISQQQLQAVADFAVQQPVLSEDVVTQLRQDYPDIHFTYCMDDDVYEMDPVYESEGFNLYLIDSREHCLRYTRDLDIATGIVLAEIEE